MDETPIICGGCGEVYAVGRLCCPKCRRCPSCGATIKEGKPESCWSCGFPTNHERVEEIKAEWNPDDPAHESLHRQREHDGRWKEFSPRINWWKTSVFLVLAFVVFNSVAIAVAQIPAVGINISAGIAQVLFGLYASWFIRRIGTGRWPWFLRPAKVDPPIEII